MIRKFLQKFIGNSEVAVHTPTVEEKIEEDTPPIVRKQSYRAQVKEKYGIDLPASDTDKIRLGKVLEKQNEFEKACACYEGCLRNRFDGSAPYDRLIILYKKLDRPRDVQRVLKRAVSVFQKVADGGRSDGKVKLEKYLKMQKQISGQ